MVPPAQLTAPLLSLLLPCSPSFAGLPDFVVVNLAQLDAKFADGEEVSLETLESKGVLNLSGREARLPLKVRRAAGVRVFAALRQQVCGCTRRQRSSAGNACWAVQCGPLHRARRAWRAQRSQQGTPATCQPMHGCHSGYNATHMDFRCSPCALPPL